MYKAPNQPSTTLTRSRFRRDRSQAESKAKDDARYKRMDPNWISWEDATRTRMACQAAFDQATSRADRLRIGEELCILTCLTFQPPDRVGGDSLHLYYSQEVCLLDSHFHVTCSHPATESRRNIGSRRRRRGLGARSQRVSAQDEQILGP